MNKLMVVLGGGAVLFGLLLISFDSERDLTLDEMTLISAGVNNKQCKPGGACGEQACTATPPGGCLAELNGVSVTSCSMKQTAGTYPYCQLENGRDCPDNPAIVCGVKKWYKSAGCSGNPYRESDGGSVCGC